MINVTDRLGPASTRRRREPSAASGSFVIRLLIVDQHQLVRAGLAALLEAADSFAIVGQAGDADEAVQLARDLQPDVVLMDLSTPHQAAPETARRLLAERAETRVVVLSSFFEQDRVIDALAAGAIGYLLKDCDPQSLIAAVRAAALGSATLDPRVAEALIPSRPDQGTAEDPSLTARESEVLTLVAQGLGNKEIGHRLGISPRTVKVHVGNIFRRIGVTNRTSAASWARKHLPDLTQ
jgi:DNA-binding NarL/FixJ family response regulator